MNDNKQPIEVDLVYMWVDGNDPVWQAKRQAITGHVENKTSADCKGRYVDNGELKYSLRSIELYAPWIRKIFIVTDNQLPEWLDTTNPKIQIVAHTETIPPEALPCFNSTVIEHFLCRIPGLSEHFLLANDDTLLNKAVTPATFFEADGLPIFRMTKKRCRKLWLWVREHVLKKELNNHLRIIANAAKLVEERYGVYYGSRTHHNIDAYNRSDYERTYETFKDASRRFRITSVSRMIFTAIFTPMRLWLKNARISNMSTNIPRLAFRYMNPKNMRRWKSAIRCFSV